MQVLRILLLTSGLLTLQLTWSQGVLTGRCSYAGVVHLEGSGKHSLNFHQAEQLCLNHGYSLSTEDQLSKAYEQGLKTCRYGWIEGQKSSFIPQDSDPNCTRNSTGISSHAEEAEKRYDVYCFTHTDTGGIICEDAAAPTAELSTVAVDVLDEVIADGFIVDTKVTTTTFVRSERSEETHTTDTTPPRMHLEEHLSQNHTQEETTFTTNVTPNISLSITTLPTDPETTTEEPSTYYSSTAEEPTDSEIIQTSVTPEQHTTASPEETSEATSTHMVSTVSNITKRDTTASPEETSEATSTHTVSTVSNITERDTTASPVETSEATSTEKPIQNFMNMEVEGSGMSSETLSEKNPEDLHPPTRLLWVPETVDGSGMEPESSNPISPTSRGTQNPPTSPAVEDPEPEEEIVAVEKPKTEAEGPVQHKGRINLPADPEPTTSARAEEGTPGWLIIFAFCMTLGAVLCVLAGIATKDKWYGASRRSLSVSGADASSKAATLSEKEQELVTLMNGAQKNDPDSTIITLQHNNSPEKEYLM